MTPLDPDVSKAFEAWFSSAKPRSLAFIRELAVGTPVAEFIDELARRHGIDLVRVSALTTGVAEFLADASRTLVGLDGSRKIILLDPCDALMTDQASSPAVLEYLRKSTRMPVVCTGFLKRSTGAKILDALKKNPGRVVTTFEFPRVTDERAILELRKTGIDDSEAVRVWAQSHGDLRSALGIAAAGFKGARDVVVDGVQAIEAILYGPKGIVEAAGIVSGDIGMVGSGIFENYPRAVRDIDACAKIADNFSVADIFEESMYANQIWALADPCAAMSTTPVLFSDTSKRVIIQKYGTVWSKNNTGRSKEKRLRALRSAGISGFAGQHGNSMEMHYVRAMIAERCASGDYPGAIDLATASGVRDHLVDFMRFARVPLAQIHMTRMKKAADLASLKSEV